MNTIFLSCNQGSRESLRGPGQNICSDCFNRVFDCSIRVYRSFGAHKQNGAQGKMPQLPPPLLVALAVITKTAKPQAGEAFADSNYMNLAKNII